MTRNTVPGPGEWTVVRVDPELAEIVPGFIQRRHEEASTILEALLRACVQSKFKWV